MSAENKPPKRRLPVGAEAQPGGGVHFRVWAPQHQKLSLVLDSLHPNREDKSLPAHGLEDEGNGYFSIFIPDASTGTRYRFRLEDLEDSEVLYPDPASRFQPDGPHGASQVIDPTSFAWSDRHWKGVGETGQVLYEMHIGTFTPEGTWRAAAQQLEPLRELGITIVEILPVADFVGRFGWGYDGVDLFAPTRLYGEPDDFRHFIDRAHTVGLGIILDVVYNHLGPEGNYLKQFAEDYFSRQHQSEWGESLNFDGKNSEPVRAFVLSNVRYWIEEFHLDGLRFDATQQLFDSSSEPILSALAREARAAAKDRSIYLVAENEPQQTQLIRPRKAGGYDLSALWNDDFHHTAMVALTGRNEAYYSDYLGSAQEFISIAKRSFLYQGQRYEWQQQRRGTPTGGLQPEQFINYLDNHDQVANSGRGYRCHMQTSPGQYRAMTAVLLLFPQTPLLFQGQEFGASTRFFYFADHREALAAKIAKGRAEFLSQFPSLAAPEMRANLPDPADPETFIRSKLDLNERYTHSEIYQLHKDLLAIRREDSVLRAQSKHCLDGAVLGPEAFLLRFFGAEANDRLLLVNFGRDLHLRPAPEPLLAPPEKKTWKILWSSEDPRYGGRGTAFPETEQNWAIPGHAALLFSAMKREAQHKSVVRI